MDGVENLAKRAEDFERRAEAASDWEAVQDKSKQGESVVSVDPLEAAGNRAEGVLRLAEGVAKLLVDSRLMLDDEEIESGRSSLAPLVHKYNLAGGGDGNLPYQAEITAGMYLGGLFKRFKRALAALKAIDKAKMEANQQTNVKPNQTEIRANNGEEREHGTQEQTQLVPIKERLGQESDPEAPVWLS